MADDVASVSLTDWCGAVGASFRRRRPVVIRHGVRGTVAARQWSPQYLANELGDLDVAVRRRKPEGAISKGQSLARMPFNEFVRQMHRHHTFFAPQMGFRRFPHLVRDLDVELLAAGEVVAVELMNLWVGDTMRLGLHYDLADLLLMQLRGHTELVIEPPESTAGRYVASYKPIMSRVDPRTVAHPAFPEYRPDLQAVATLHPGDVLYVPAGWWYDAFAVGPSVWATAWYGPALPIPSVPGRGTAWIGTGEPLPLPRRQSAPAGDELG